MNKFIAFEGPEGSGKSTIIKMVEEALVARGVDVVSTREPGGIKISEDIRSVILNEGNTNMDSTTEMLLFAAARRQHLVEKVIPALESGKVVLCDRFVMSSYVYQGLCREDLSYRDVKDINEKIVGNYMPSVHIILNVRPEVGLARINNNGREQNRIDKEGLDFHTKVQQAYLALASCISDTMVIDAEGSIEETLEQVMNIINLELESV